MENNLTKEFNNNNNNKRRRKEEKNKKKKKRRRKKEEKKIHTHVIFFCKYECVYFMLTLYFFCYYIQYTYISLLNFNVDVLDDLGLVVHVGHKNL